MRVLHINCNYVATTLHQSMIEKMDALGIENEVFVPVFNRNVAAIKPNDNVYVSECFNKWNRLFYRYKQRRIIKAIEDHYDVNSFDLIHAYTTFTDGNAACILSEKYGVPYVVAVRNTDVNTFFRWMPHLRQIGIRILKEAKRVFFLSGSYEKQVMEKFVPPKDRRAIAEKTSIIPNGIHDFWLENKPQSRHRPEANNVRLIYVGRIDRNKNILTTQKAMKCLRKQGITTRLTVVGRCVDKAVFREVKSDDYTECISNMSMQELIGLYRENDIFVMPSRAESFGLVYAEAMSQGLPVIYTKCQGFDGQFPEGYIGFHVDPNSPDEICEAVKTIVSHYPEMSDRCIERSRKFNWVEISEQYEAVYAYILGNSKRVDIERTGDFQ